MEEDIELELPRLSGREAHAFFDPFGTGNGREMEASSLVLLASKP